MAAIDNSQRPEFDAIALMGPTASGKSALAMALCESLPMEIISVDSAQVYRQMDIGTAKPSVAEQARVPHHLIDICDPSEAYSAARFRADAIGSVRAVRNRGRIPLLVGGTMLYYKALRDGLAEMPGADASVRRRIAALAEVEGWQAVHDRLRDVDPSAAARIHGNDPQRLQRALEVYEITGVTLSEWHRRGQSSGPFSLLELAVLPPDRAALHQRIAARFDRMLEARLVDEVRALFERGDLSAELPSIKAVGYRQVWSYLAGELSWDEMRERAIVATRQLAKRQLTWLRGWPELHVLAAPDKAEALKILESTSILDRVANLS